MSDEMGSNIDFQLPSFKNWKASRFYDYSNEIFDYGELEELNKAVNEARRALFEVTEAINTYERREKLARTKYSRSHRRIYLESVGKTEAEKKARADIKCEDLEDDVLVYEQVRIELTRLSNAIRLELQTLQSLGNNLRQQMKVE